MESACRGAIHSQVNPHRRMLGPNVHRPRRGRIDAGVLARTKRLPDHRRGHPYLLVVRWSLSDVNETIDVPIFSGSSRSLSAEAGFARIETREWTTALGTP